MIAQPRDLSAADPETALDLIFVEGFTGETVIGIDSSELHQPQPLVIDVHAGLPHVPACESDSIGDTIHYGVVCERLRRLLASHSHQLLESFAEEIARILLVEFGAAWVRVKVVKPRKFDDVQAVGVQIERRASALPAEAATASQRGAGVLRLIGSGMVPGTR
ncbi:MAG: dihydroneopterin aldolase [Burkholderiales bacterium]|nr:dihydroneopterin aldolase [Burkholderiales bacterium]